MARNHLWRTIKDKAIFSTLGGMALGAIGIGIVVMILVFWIEPMSAPERAGTVRFQENHFTLWYEKGSEAAANHAALAQELNRDLTSLVNLLDVDASLIPDPIDVFVHDDVSAMQSSIMMRKSPEARGGHTAPLDLLVGESPRERLAELVLAFGWGQCGSELMKRGMTIYATQPERNYHGVLASLPARLLVSLPQLVLLEERGRFPRSVYEQYDSPYSSAAIAFADYKSLFDLSADDAGRLSDILSMEAASFVQFLIEEKGGMREVKRIWGKGTTDRLLARIEADSIAGLGDEWYAFAKDYGRLSDDYEYLRVYYLLGDGDPDGAWEKAQGFETPDASQDQLFLAGRCALLVGRFDRAKTIVTELADGAEKDLLRHYLTLLESFRVVESQNVRLFISPTVPPSVGEDRASAAMGGYGRIVEQLGVGTGETPARLTIFIYANNAELDQSKGLVLFPPVQNAVLNILSSDDVCYRMAEMMPAYCWGVDTYSRLLRSGLAVALCRSKQELANAGCALRSNDGWIPLNRTDFGTGNEETVKTEAGLMLRHLLDTGVEELHKIWIATSPSDRYLTFDAALQEVKGETRDDIEASIVSSVLICN